MLDKQMRYLKEAILTPLAKHVGAYLSPTGITLIGGVVGIAAATFAWQGYYAVGLALWLLNRILDGLDGTVARMFNHQSDLGGYIDILIDFLIYAAIPIGLALSIGSSVVYLALIFMLASFYVNSASWMFLSSILEKRKQGASVSGEMTSVTMPDGLIEGTETIVVYALFFLLSQFLAELFIIMGILVAVTIVQRIHWATRNLDLADSPK